MKLVGWRATAVIWLPWLIGLGTIVVWIASLFS